MKALPLELVPVPEVPTRTLALNKARELMARVAEPSCAEAFFLAVVNGDDWVEIKGCGSLMELQRVAMALLQQVHDTAKRQRHLRVARETEMALTILGATNTRVLGGSLPIAPEKPE